MMAMLRMSMGTGGAGERGLIDGLGRGGKWPLPATRAMGQGIVTEAASGTGAESGAFLVWPVRGFHSRPEMLGTGPERPICERRRLPPLAPAVQAMRPGRGAGRIR